MFASSLTAKRFLLKALPLMAALLLSISFTSLVQAQDSERQRAIDLFEANNFVAALPLLEKVSAALPNDIAILSRLGLRFTPVRLPRKILRCVRRCATARGPL